MTTSVMQMITDARAQVGTVAPKAAADELGAGAAVVVDVREPEEWQHGHIDGAVARPTGAARVLRRSDQPPPQRRPRPRPPQPSSCAPPAPGPRWRRSRSRSWATRTSPCSTAGSRGGRTPACPPASTSTRASNDHAGLLPATEPAP